VWPLDYKKIALWSAATIAVVIVVVLYRNFNPIQSNLFPKCPFRVLTGYMCPGCGAQRALHYLFNFDVLNAAKQNFLLVASIPYVVLGLAFDHLLKPTAQLAQWRKRLYGKNAIVVVLVLIVGFWVMRNMW
jgi:hypothetical protein